MRWVSLCVCVQRHFFLVTACVACGIIATHIPMPTLTRVDIHTNTYTQTHTSDHPLLLYLKWLTLIWTVTPFTGMSLFMLTFTVVQAWVQFAVLNQGERTFSISKNSYSGWIIPVLPLFLLLFDLIWFDLNVAQILTYLTLTYMLQQRSTAGDPLYVLELSLCVLLFHLFWTLASWHSTWAMLWL